jgi:hypothetical protein
VKLRHAEGLKGQGTHGRSALLRDGDDVVLVVFDDRTERLWIEGS